PDVLGCVCADGLAVTPDGQACECPANAVWNPTAGQCECPDPLVLRNVLVDDVPVQMCACPDQLSGDGGVFRLPVDPPDVCRGQLQRVDVLGSAAMQVTHVRSLEVSPSETAVVVVQESQSSISIRF